MFRRLLIANRGEVAVRVARGARELGVTPIGVASQADLGAAWLSEMEEVVCIGGSAPRESYLLPERLVQAAKQTRCAAVHPGWGFLAESSRFAALCAQHGLSFVGPPPGVMELMGRKLSAKRAMAAAGLAGIPGGLEALESVDDARARAEEMGYPVLLKADAGGGGRGMRLCRNREELTGAFASAAAEAEGAFGDATLYLERYVEGGRHVEVQVLCDAYGHAVHLGERECSIQRSHQKLIEESPSPALTADQRAELGARAAAAAASIGYVGAGTLEFLLDRDGRLAFMEMNARLQVEHPVSELVSGVDLVHWQLRVAAGEPLTLRQEEIAFTGAAIECRINAEDPANGFRPAPGTLAAFDFPRELGPGTVRVDTHLAAGEKVPPYYDSLIAKVIAHAPTRAEAIETMRRCLDAAEVAGLPTTIPLHLAVLASAEFQRGTYDTASIPGWRPAAAAK